MTIAWSGYAQSLTAQPMKGMLTGPMTILQWSFLFAMISRGARPPARSPSRSGMSVLTLKPPASGSYKSTNLPCVKAFPCVEAIGEVT